MGSEKLESFRLGERCSIKSSKRIFAREYVEAGVPFWRSKDVIDKSLGVFQQFDLYISKERFNEISGKYGSPQKGDLLISSVGNRSGQPYVVQEEGEFYFKDGNILWINDFVELDAEFLSYWLKSSKGQAALSSVMIGSAQKALTIDALRSLQVHLPVYEMQLSAVKMLKILDNKITLNRQINQTLEQMAQTLFKSWFVDFDPVIDNALDAGNAIPDELQARAEQRQALRHAVNEANAAKQPHSTRTNPAASDALATPYKPLPDEIRQLFPNEFEESELGWVPKGWSVDSISSLIKLIGGGTPKTSEDSYWGGDIPWFSVVDAPNDSDVFVLDTEKKVTEKGVNNSSTKILRPGTTIISARGTVGKCALVSTPMAMNQSCYGVIGSDGVHDYFVYYLLRHSVKQLQQRGHGSVFNTITRDTFSSLKLAHGDLILTQLFGELITPWFNKILANNQQKISLERLRDTLLPKLISGELRLDEVESTIAETTTA
ncbi:restriction endonuclease subunit S [Vibrio tritonius]|uniref:restriction endonuclease subunit S n=1 Tax=Vibrio tritonius TaxID=1435069 RepID=UPI00315CEF38